MQLGSKTLALPLIQGGMGIGVSLGKLAGHVARTGAMGVVSAANPGYAEADFWQNPVGANFRALKREIQKAKELSQGKGLVGVNVMVATQDYAQCVTTAMDAGADAIISGAGLPLKLPELAAGRDVLIAPIVSSGKAASLICRSWQKRYQRLPDFLVLEGSLAGGHLGFPLEQLQSGTTSPLPQLLDEVIEATKPFGHLPVFVAGGIESGKELVNWIEAGAAGVQVATQFIATHECDASQGYKEIMVNAKPQDVTIVKSPVGMPGRALLSPLMERVAQGRRELIKHCSRCLAHCNPAETPYCITKALIDGVEGKWETGLFFCGANVGNIKEIVSVKQLVSRLTEEWSKR